MGARTPVTWRLRTRVLDTTDHTLIMGIINVTPDSFSDGGSFASEGPPGRVDHDAAVAHGRALIGAGADLVDVGGESTRPGAAAVSEAEEAHRVLPVVAGLSAAGAVVSIDTTKPAVAARALDAGAEIVNDVTGLGDPGMIEVCAERDAGVVIMHMQGTPRTMQEAPTYDDVVAEVVEFLENRAQAAIAGGIAPGRICIDPGIGFGKTYEHNLALLANLDRCVDLGYPVLLGSSRKRFLGRILDDAGVENEPIDRDTATGATTALAIAAGVAVVRVHAVGPTLEVGRVADAIVRSASQFS